MKFLRAALLAYGAASLAHFIHNAEFIADYPGLPQNWTRAGVYAAWLAITAIGLLGWALVKRHRGPGLLVIGVYALAGMDSLGHYVLAPLTAHSVMMNLTILLEVAAAALVLAAATSLVLWRRPSAV